MKVRAWTAAIACLMLVAVACSSTEDANEDAVADTTTTVVAPTTTAAPTTTTTSATTSDEDRATAGFDVLRDEQVVYFTDDEGDWTMDVFHPSEPGPWPLVVIYHGMTTNPSASEARTIAGTGAVVVAPRWIKRTPPTMTREEYIDGHEFDRAACAAVAAQSLAARYGADPANTTIAGFSAGMHPAAWVGLGVVREDLCGVPMSHLPTGVVLGDSQFLFYEDGWDESFAADPAWPAADTTDRFVNPERWNLDPDVAVYLWTSDAVHGRAVTNPPASDSWIVARDTTGDLLEDLEALDAFDDEFIDWRDNAKLLEMRLAESGYSVIREDVGGGHTYGASVFEMIDTLIHRDPLGPVNAQTGWVWPSTETLTDLAASFCDDFPIVDGLLHDQVSLAAVPEDGWDTETSEVLRGRDVVESVLGAQEVVVLECGDVVTRADWVAIPYVLVEPYGPVVEGVFVLKSTTDGEATWIAWYRSVVEGATSVEAVADGARVAEAMSTCEAIEGHRITRDADDYLALMTDDPAIHSIPNGYHMDGVEGVRRTVELYPYSDDIACIDITTGTATWSVIGMTLDNEGFGIAIEGPVVHQHTDDGIRAIYHHWTDAGMSPGLEAGTWGTAPAP